jgi:hypothetical protein
MVGAALGEVLAVPASEPSVAGAEEDVWPGVVGGVVF